MNESMNMNSLCDASKVIIGTPQLYPIHGLESIFGVLAFFPNLLVIYLLCGTNAFHPNLRILLCNYSFVLAWYSMCTAGKAVHRLLTPVCGLPSPFRACIPEEILLSLPLHNSVMSLLSLCLERLYVTFRYKSYDYGQSPYLALFLLSCVWTATAYMDFSAYAFVPDGVWVPVCDFPIFGNPAKVLPLLLVFVAMELVCVSINIFVYTYNRYILKGMVINRAKFDLSARFVVDQNLKLCWALIPSDILHVAFYIPSYAFLLTTMFNVSLELSTKMWFLHSTYLYRILFAIIHPVVLITRNPTLRQRVMRTNYGVWFRRMRRCIRGNEVVDQRMTSTKAANLYFDQLEAAWAEAHKQRKGSGICG